MKISKTNPMVTKRTLEITRKLNKVMVVAFTILTVTCLVGCFTAENDDQFVGNTIGLLFSASVALFFLVALSDSSLNPKNVK